MEELLKNWENIKEQVKIDHSISDIAYKTWILPLTIYDYKEDTVLIRIPKELEQGKGFYINKYQMPFMVAISESLHKECEVKFVIEQDIEKELSLKGIDNSKKELYEKANLNNKYTFDTFVVGSSNRFAYSACVATADAPGEIYNPLFLYGGVGLGKTHLMHSIAHYIIDNNENANVLYVTSEHFTNEVIEAIRMGKDSPARMSKFREKYRNIDVLLIDDIQFIIGKESTQEEFFHTFNQLYEQKKQIIISSDKPPKDMDILEERYKSRFGWGLIADIQTPDFETRTAILLKKIELENLNLDDEVVKYIAENVKSNIRELEGALTKIVALSKLEKKSIDINLAKDALKDIVSPDSPLRITPDYIIRVVCDHYGVKEEEIVSKKRNKDLIIPRHVIMYLCRKYTDYTYKGIGALIGNRDHSTVINAENEIENLLKIDEGFKKTLETITNKINSN